MKNFEIKDRFPLVYFPGYIQYPYRSYFHSTSCKMIGLIWKFSFFFNCPTRNCVSAGMLRLKSTSFVSWITRYLYRSIQNIVMEIHVANINSRRNSPREQFSISLSSLSCYDRWSRRSSSRLEVDRLFWNWLRNFFIEKYKVFRLEK